MAVRGRHKVFLGMAPGVGKTFQMLEEGREEQRRGRDVAIGYLEPHGRADTVEQSAGLPTIPRRRIDYHGTMLEEMDLPAILRRRPALCLIDELAHRNVPGSEHAKRYEDVNAVLEAGIDVYSTVNVQHVESLAGRMAALTGVAVEETLPDQVLDQADDVVLVDITPELLIERLKTGKIYPADQAAVALHGFFRPERLATLREVSLLQTVEEVESKSGAERRQAMPSRQQETLARQHVLALATPDRWMRPTVHHAYRAARRLDASFDVLWVRAPASAPGTDDDADVAALERLVETLGGTLLVRRSRRLVETVVEVAVERGTTYLVMGLPRRRTRLGLLAHRRLPLGLMRALPDVDLQIVALHYRP